MAALLPSCCLTRTTRVAVRPRHGHARPGQPARFDWPAEGTDEFLGRARRVKAPRAQPASLATARRPEPLYVFGAAGATSDNRKKEPRGALNASSLARLRQRSLRSLPPCGGQKKTRKIGLRLLTIQAIYVL